MSFLFARYAFCAFYNNEFFRVVLFGYVSIYGLVLIFFSQMDAKSRYQNYKLAKDLFYENGFKERIANFFINSRCQREAVAAAASDLNMKQELKAYYFHCGYRWYHFIPDIVIRKPGVLMTRTYWKKTLFVKPYRSKYFYW